MKLFLIRQGIAQDRDTWTGLDSLRPLTQRGKDRFSKISQALRKFIPQLDAIYSSELLRAIETAEILKTSFNSPLLVTPTLNLGMSNKDRQDILDQAQDHEYMACVGHQPDLSALLSYILAGKIDYSFRFKKGGIASIEINFEQDYAQLNWLLMPKHLI